MKGRDLERANYVKKLFDKQKDKSKKEKDSEKDKEASKKMDKKVGPEWREEILFIVAPEKSKDLPARDSFFERLACHGAAEGLGNKGAEAPEEGEREEKKEPKAKKLKKIMKLLKELL